MTRQRQSTYHTIRIGLRWLTITLGTICTWQAVAQNPAQGSNLNWPTRKIGRAHV